LEFRPAYWGFSLKLQRKKDRQTVQYAIFKNEKQRVLKNRTPLPMKKA